ncbi:MAG: acyloxyacyl hydrolase [Phycisphaeraceae bacterium]|nr:acyloxyacyl hydrolase [Phycisphaerae bacterium]MBX3393496.1 acyloxyacyl hydrolase [Phycisphaeraceae bacterium]
MIPRLLSAAVALGSCAAFSHASGSSSLDTTPAAVSIQPAAPSDAEPSPAPPLLAYGAEGSQWVTFGYGAADNFENAVDQYVSFTWSTFLAKDVELGLEAGVWYFNQPGDNEAGLSGSLIFRWHFYTAETWTAYLAAGIGVLGATGNVPDTGTSFGLLPRAGVGVTKQLTDDGLRLDVGIRWHHISNARIHGDDDNPSRDGAMLYAGLIFPF